MYEDEEEVLFENEGVKQAEGKEVEEGGVVRDGASWQALRRILTVRSTMTPAHFSRSLLTL